MFCLLIISCSDKKEVDMISEPMWREPLDASVFTMVQDEAVSKIVNFEMNGMQYSVYLYFEKNQSEIEPVVIDIKGKKVNSNDNKESFTMRMENYKERYFNNEIIHKDIGFVSLFDKKNNTLKYKQFPNASYDYQNQIAVTDEESTVIFIYPEWELEEDWKIVEYD
jgi:hypothetical protein